MKGLCSRSKANLFTLLRAGCRENLEQVYIRQYRKDDIDTLYDLDVRCFPVPFRFSREQIRYLAESAGAVVLLACQIGGGEEAILGFCIATLEGPAKVQVGYIATLDVAPAHRLQGIGRALINSVTEALATKTNLLLLHVFTGNTGAVRLYERLSFTRIRLERGFYGPGLDAWVYQKQLKPTEPGGDPGSDKSQAEETCAS